jgi:hypothetical protein
MLSPKYDLNNYIKHLTVPVITDNQRIKQLFKSSLLRVKWNHNPLNKQAFNDIGILRIHIDTPFGLLRPQDYRLQVDAAKKTYIQFVSIYPKPDFDYEIEIISPAGMTRSMIEIWEFIDPSDTNMNYIAPQQGTDPALLSALTGLTTGMANQAGQIADAIANNGVIVENFANILVGTTQSLLLAADNTRQSVVVTNWSLFKVKLWHSTASLSSLSYGSDGAFITLDAAKQIGSETIQGGLATLDTNECKGNLYAVGQSIAGTHGLAVTTTRTAP